MSIILFCLTAFILGFRHGLDFDHIAAMLDMSGSSAAENASAQQRKPNLWQRIKLPFLYVLGHAVMVDVLGVTALCFGAVIPEWLDQIMERIVGITLLLLSFYLLYSLIMFLLKGHELKLRSRWMIVFSAVAKGWNWLKSTVTTQPHKHKHEAVNWDAKGAFSVGLIHGFGAETGTQVLLFASIAGSGNLFVASAMLLFFTVGMAISTIAIALCVSAGLTSSAYFKPLLFVLGVVAALFSLAVGLYFTFGFSALLPSF